jgi:pimeloyl-ACP methyl ester carboxylesterase
MLRLPYGYRGIAPDLRGYGWSEAKPANAVFGLADYAGDIQSLVETLGLTRFHLVGHSMGAGVAQQYAIDHPDRLLSLTLVDPVSPFGFGGTKTADGQPVYADFAGSGGGTVNQEFVKYIQEERRDGGNPNLPRDVINNFYYKPPFRSDREEDILTSLLAIQTGPEYYPGDMVPSANWPFVAPGENGVANAFAPKYSNTSGLANIQPQVPILWIQAREDQIVSDNSLFDFGTLGKLGLIPGWPGEEIYPPQPMVAQMRYVLEQYRSNGGSYELTYQEISDVLGISRSRVCQLHAQAIEGLRRNG